MSVQFETLGAALANRYRIERQLGEGGKGTAKGSMSSNWRPRRHCA